MKSKLLTFALGVLTVGLLGSCSKINERIDGLEKRVDGIENEKIASINTQIEKINTSIADLGTIRESISNLKTATETHAKELAERKKAEEVLGGRTDKLEEEIQALNQQVADLQAADAALGQRIDELKTFVRDTLRAYATTEWVEATFSTLEQYEATCDAIAKINARISDLDARLSNEIAGLVGSLKAWVNKQFEGYYTAAEVDAIVEDLQSQIDSFSKKDPAKEDPRIDSLATELTATKAAIETAKDSIRAEYKTAITDAITQSEGKMTSVINSAIAEVNSKITELTNDVNELKNRVNALTGRVDALEKMIQSIAVIPEYTDGSVVVDEGILTAKFVASPAGSVKEVKKDNILVFVNRAKAKTKAPLYYAAVTVSNAEVNPETGEVEITADISCQVREAIEAGEGLTVAVNVCNGNVCEVTSDFVPVSFAKAAVPQDVVTSGVFTVARQGCRERKVFFSKGNLTASDEGGTYIWEFAKNQYDFIGNKSDKTDVFKWSTVDGDYGISTYSEDGDFKDWGIPYCNQELLKEGTWRTMDKDEWKYLLMDRVVNGGTGNGHSFSYPVTCQKRRGLVIYPDYYNGPVLEKGVDYQEVPSGVAFLPCGTDYSFWSYWASSPKEVQNNPAWGGVWLDLLSDQILSPQSNTRDHRFSVRLVSDVKFGYVPEFDVVPVEKVSFTKSSINMDLFTGNTKILRVNFFPEEATDRFLTWKSSDESVATVDAGGKVKAKSLGQAKITATTADGSRSASCIVNVEYKEPGQVEHLPGVFKVSDTKKVYFSQGNLTCDISEETPVWEFYDSQYQYATEYDDELISLFTWGYGDWSTDPATTKYSSTTFNDWGAAYCEQHQLAPDTWFTLSSGEWGYLFENNTKKANVTINGVIGCTVFAPEGYTKQINSSYSATEWQEAEKEGLVCLAPAGFRIGTTLKQPGSPGISYPNGHYWSSTAYDSSQAWYLRFERGDSIFRITVKGDARAVRLVTEVKDEVK